MILVKCKLHKGKDLCLFSWLMVPNKERSDGHILTQHLLLNERFPQFFSCFTSNPSSLINYTTSKLYPPPPSHLHLMPTILLISYLRCLKQPFFFLVLFPFLLFVNLFSLQHQMISYQSLKILHRLPIGLKRKYELHYLAYKALNDHGLTLHFTTVSNFSLILVIGLLWIPGNIWSLSTSDTCCFFS